MITYNMTRWLIFQAVQTHAVAPLNISFLDTLQWIIDCLGPMQQARPGRLWQYHTYLHHWSNVRKGVANILQ